MLLVGESKCFTLFWNKMINIFFVTIHNRLNVLPEDSCSVISLLSTISSVSIKYLFIHFIHYHYLKGNSPFKVNYQYLDPGSWYCQFYSHERNYSFSINQSQSKPRTFPWRSKVENFILPMFCNVDSDVNKI